MICSAISAKQNDRGRKIRQGRSAPPAESQKIRIPLLQSHLSNMRHEKAEVEARSAALEQHEDAISRELAGKEQRTVPIIADASPHRLIVSDPHLHTTP